MKFCMLTPRHGTVFLVCALLAGCGGDTHGTEPDSAVQTDAATSDSEVDAAAVDADIDAAVDAAADAGPDAFVPLCDLTDHTGCGLDALCCEITGDATCVPTSTNTCTACGVVCSPVGADGCTDRQCQCGSGPACTGATPLCDTAAGACAECLSSTDCTNEQCVAGVCEECDPADNAGCSGATPICNATSLTCEACTLSPDNCVSPLVCTVSGECAGCDPINNGGCVTPTTPVCDDVSSVCRSCASPAECQTEFGLDYCLGDGRCAPCDPADDGGCSGTTPICRPGTGGDPSCTACLSDGECAALPGTTVCADTGPNLGACVQCDASDQTACSGATPLCDLTSNLCVECVNDGDCSGQAPICDATGVCRACASDPECAAMTGQTVCAEAGVNLGACVECDLADQTACVGVTPACETNLNICVECTSSWLHCGGTAPICENYLCRGCTGDDDCALYGVGTSCAGDGACW